VLGRPEPVSAPLADHGPRAPRRRLRRALAGAALVIVALVALWWLAGLSAWAWLVSLLVPPAAGALAADRYRSLGHAVVAGRLVSRRGSLVRRRWALSCEGIIGWNIEQTFFQRRAGLATLSATTAAGRQRYDVQDVGVEEALRVAEEAVPGLLAPFLVP
jgi:putative membrane protein